MHFILIILVGLFAFPDLGPKESGFISIPKEEIRNGALKNVPDHRLWDNLLRQFVTKEGNVDYKGIGSNTSNLNAYLDHLADTPPKEHWSKNEKLAYYINLYNAATVKLIVDTYPIKSIKDLPRPWAEKRVRIGPDLLSLGDIEHEILRKMAEPRIHFAINCASYSCPKLGNQAFTASQMEAQLEKATEDFINDPARNKYSNKKASLSLIFKWYKKDFTDNGKLLDFINRYLSQPIKAGTKIDFLTYDWNLNEAL